MNGLRCVDEAGVRLAQVIQTLDQARSKKFKTEHFDDGATAWLLS